MRRVPRAWAPLRWPMATLLAFHGLIHLIGVVSAWGLAAAPALSGPTMLPLAGWSLRLFGFTWLIACLTLLASALLLARKQPAWAGYALIGMALSQIVIVLWWRDAWAGTLPNLIVLGFIAWQVTMGAQDNRLLPRRR